MGLHILFSPETTTEREREQLAGLTKNERRYLSRRGCGGCMRPLHPPGCGDFWIACKEEAQIERRRKCLAAYRPRRGGKHKNRNSF